MSSDLLYAITNLTTSISSLNDLLNSLEHKTFFNKSIALLEKIENDDIIEKVSYTLDYINNEFMDNTRILLNNSIYITYQIRKSDLVYRTSQTLENIDTFVVNSNELLEMFSDFYNANNILLCVSLIVGCLVILTVIECYFCVLKLRSLLVSSK